MLVVNEIMDFVTRNKKECMVVKVDFQKAYDCVSWDFLKYMFKLMNFRSCWLQWMNVLIVTISMSVLVNDSLTEEFQLEKGLR